MSIQDLKASLSATIAEAESGETILITRHNQTIAQLSPARIVRTHGSRDSALPPLRPLLRRATRGRYLEVLLEDRSGEQ
jgi:antitoxin (DNA-binding transcriptional repressor) of toxin-antitoxin stability system